jgi:hypothetical protein
MVGYLWDNLAQYTDLLCGINQNGADLVRAISYKEGKK